MGGKFHPKHSALWDVKKWNPEIKHTFRVIKLIKRKQNISKKMLSFTSQRKMSIVEQTVIIFMAL